MIGLSKINRIVRFFAQRPQVQERLTQQILVALQTLLGTKNVAVSIDAVHYCVKARGVRDATSATTTTSLGGLFKTSQNTRQEFCGRYATTPDTAIRSTHRRRRPFAGVFVFTARGIAMSDTMHDDVRTTAPVLRPWTPYAAWRCWGFC